MININYASIRSLDISNGEGVGVALFVQGCHFHCHNCFNPETWNFNDGKEWTQETENIFLSLADKPYVTRISILGGEPLADENIHTVCQLINRIHCLLPDKTIWLYTGYTWEQIWEQKTNNFNQHKFIPFDEVHKWLTRKEIVSKCDVVVDGQYMEEFKDINYPWAGSANQRCIDVKKTLQQGKIILFNR